MGTADVSVVIRSCGRPALLRRTLLSIAAQTVQPREIIVVAIGAAGEGAAALPALPVTAMVRSGEARCRGGALNDGIAAAQSQWIAFLDDDDTWAPTFLEEMIAAIPSAETQPPTGCVVCQTEAVYERVRNGIVSECGREPFNPDLTGVDSRRLFEKNRFTINAALWHRHVFIAVGGFSEKLPVLEDWEFNMRASREFSIGIVPRMLARYHQRPPGDPVPNTNGREHDRWAGELQREWTRMNFSGSGPAFTPSVSFPAASSLKRLRSRLATWWRWRQR